MIYLYLYADCFMRALRGAAKSPWTLALPIVYAVGFSIAAVLLSSLGIIAGFILGILFDFCFSSFLYFVGQTVLGSPSHFSELKKSFVEYFWPVMSLVFVLWIGSTALGYALANNPQAPRLGLAVGLIAFVLLNAVPEVIYQKAHIGGIAIIVESAKFIQEHWIEWFIPNVVIVAVVVGVYKGLALIPLGALLWPPIFGALAYFCFAFRGSLYHVLDTTSPFQLRVRYHGGVGLGR